MDKYFEQGTLSDDELMRGLQTVFAEGSMYPVICTSGLKDMGIRRLMGFLGEMTPSVADAPKPLTVNAEEVAPVATAPTSAFIFKTSVEPHIGEVNYFKVMQGTLKPGDDVLNVDR